MSRVGDSAADEPRTQVPAPLDVPERLLGPLTGRQAGWLLLAVLGVLLAVTGREHLQRLAGGLALAAAAGLTAVVRPGGRCPEDWLLPVLRYLRRRCRARWGLRGRVRGRARRHRRRRLPLAAGLAAGAAGTALVVGLAAGGLIGAPARPPRHHSSRVLPLPPPAAAAATPDPAEEFARVLRYFLSHPAAAGS